MSLIRSETSTSRASALPKYGLKRGSLLRYSYEYAAFLIWCFYKLTVRMGLQGRHYAAVDVNNLPDFLVFAAAYAKWRGAKVVFDMHEITPEFYVSKYGMQENSFVIHLLKWIEKISFNFADHVITINEPITNLLISRGLTPGKSTEIMNSVDESMFEAARKQPTSETESKPGVVLMYHGTLTRIYGLDIAIEAFALARASLPDASRLRTSVSGTSHLSMATQ